MCVSTSNYEVRHLYRNVKPYTREFEILICAHLSSSFLCFVFSMRVPSFIYRACPASVVDLVSYGGLGDPQAHNIFYKLKRKREGVEDKVEGQADHSSRV